MMKRRWIKYLLLVIAVAAFGRFVYHTSVFRPAKNFHEIDPGKFYRSAQLTNEEFEEVARTYGIKTVINLRGEQGDEPWYINEKQTLDRLGIPMHNLGFSTEHLQFKDDWKKYVEILRDAPRPILVHCRSGADRTGEASAIYQIEFMGKSNEQALDQLSFRYLHLSFLYPAKTLFVKSYQGLDWVAKVYDPCSELFLRYAGNRCSRPK